MIRNGNNGETFFGLSTDTKLVNDTDGSIFKTSDTFLEIDTGDLYFFDEDNNTWVLPS